MPWAVGLVASLGLAACSQPQEESPGADDKPKVGVILPDQASSVRWETADRRYLEEAAAAVDALARRRSATVGLR